MASLGGSRTQLQKSDQATWTSEPAQSPQLSADNVDRLARHAVLPTREARRHDQFHGESRRHDRRRRSDREHRYQPARAANYDNAGEQPKACAVSLDAGNRRREADANPQQQAREVEKVTVEI